jgi:hypothetical protein
MPLQTPRISVGTQVVQCTSAVFSATLIDENDDEIPVSALAAVSLTLKEYTTGIIINSRDNQSVLNINDVTFDSNGLMVWQAQPADNDMVLRDDKETHVARFEFETTSGKRGVEEINYQVRRRLT